MQNKVKRLEYKLLESSVIARYSRRSEKVRQILFLLPALVSEITYENLISNGKPHRQFNNVKVLNWQSGIHGEKTRGARNGRRLASYTLSPIKKRF